MELVVKAEEYGPEYAGVWQVRRLTYSQGRGLLQQAARTGDQVGYIEELMLLSVSGPVQLTKSNLGEHPNGLIRRLQDASLELNEVNRKESAFLSSSPSEEQPPSQKTRIP